MDEEPAKEGTSQFVRVDIGLVEPTPHHNTYGYSFTPSESYHADVYWTAVKNVCRNHDIEQPFWQSGMHDKDGWQYFEFLGSPTTDEFASTLIGIIEEIHTEAERLSAYHMTD
ncbi:MAG: hypothetical protein UZ21_OP11001000266 [Microgenomates bacterium OLB22]|nr:MAG: hypothetical protein UZ21_OP11001000266 [Microgenomates bacterium OLB22]